MLWRYACGLQNNRDTTAITDHYRTRPGSADDGGYSVADNIPIASPAASPAVANTIRRARR